jgi:C4-dicarboxylate transporter, DctM subunit
MLILIIVIVIIALFGAPLFSVLASIAMVNFANIGTQILVVPQEMAGIVNTPLIYSIPLFTFAGYILASGNASHRMVRFTKAAIGWIPGGLPIVTLLTCAVFTAFTGASGVTIVALGAFLLPALLSEKYTQNFSYGLVTTSGSIGLLFPPSLPLILFGVIAGASIDKLFIAGIVPGFIIIIIYSIYAISVSVKQKIEVTEFSLKELKDSFLEMKWEIPLPIILVAGVFSGKMAISDAAAITAVYILVVEVFIMRDVKIKALPGIMKESMVLVGAILIILSSALAATNFMIDQQIPQKMFENIKYYITNKWMFLIILNIFLLIAGSILELYSSLIIIVPLILPIAEAYNINLIHLGIIFLANLEIGFLLPPFGMNLFIASLRFGKPVVEFFIPAIKFVILSIVALMLITYVPELSIWFIEKPSIVGSWEYPKEDGTVDRIILKAGGKYLRKKGDMITIMMNPPDTGNYEIKKNILTLSSNNVREKYKFEIYNDGKKLLLENPENKKESAFYNNTLSPYMKEKGGKFIGKWITTDLSIEFQFNGESKWIKNGVEETLYYKIKGDKIVFIKDFEDWQTKKPPEYKFKFDKNNILNLSNKINSYSLKLTDSINDL